jgi:Tol biopolymer transport system component
MSGDGRFVAFESTARLAPEDDNILSDVFVYDRATGRHDLVSVSLDGTSGRTGAFSPTISGDGRFVVFVAEDGHLVTGDTNQGLDVFLRDRTADTTEIVSIADDESPASGPGFSLSSFGSGVSDDGRYVAFESTADNLVPGDLHDIGDGDVFLRDRVEGTTAMASTPVVAGASWAGDGHAASISADGRFVAFDSYQGGLIEEDPGAGVFVFDREDGSKSRLSSSGDYPVISRDGSRAAYIAATWPSIPEDDTFTFDVFVAQRR